MKREEFIVINLMTMEIVRNAEVGSIYMIHLTTQITVTIVVHLDISQVSKINLFVKMIFLMRDVI
jgi:hypothetical protein